MPYYVFRMIIVTIYDKLHITSGQVSILFASSIFNAKKPYRARLSQRYQQLIIWYATWFLCIKTARSNTRFC